MINNDKAINGTILYTWAVAIMPNDLIGGLELFATLLSIGLLACQIYLKWPEVLKKWRDRRKGKR